MLRPPLNALVLVTPSRTSNLVVSLSLLVTSSQSHPSTCALRTMLPAVICNASKTSVALAETIHTAAAAISQQPSTLASDACAAALGAVPEGAMANMTKAQPPELAPDKLPAALGSLAPELWEIFLVDNDG